MEYSSGGQLGRTAANVRSLSHYPEVPASQDPDGLLTETQVAQLTGLSIRTYQAWRLRGGGPRYIKIGRSIRYKRADVLEWIESNATSNTSAAGTGPEVG